MMRSSRTLFTLVLFLGLFLTLLKLASPGNAKNSDPLNLQAIDEFLAGQVKTSGIPGVAVAIVQGDRLIFSKGYGEAAPGKPVTPQTQFFIGSITKSFTALAAMQLVEQGRLDLDAPVQRYLPWFRVASPDASSQITVRNLLNHTSGLSEVGDPNASAYTSSLDEQARLLQYAHPTASTGSQYQYYNQNYRLVGLLIEQASGQSYGDYLQSSVFKPLGMAHSTTDPAKASKLAQGYSRIFGFPLAQSQRFIPGALPSGYLISTADDMAHFLIAQINNRRVDGQPLLAPTALAEMRTPPAGITSNYGMGWLVMENGNTLAYGGALEYFQSFVVIGLKEKIGLVILYNQNSLENTLVENNAIRDGLLNFLNGKPPQQPFYGWIGWLLLGLATADLLNHLRLLWTLPRWAQKTSTQNRFWLWAKVLAGILIPLAVIFGLPLLVKGLQGGSPSWVEPFQLMPDLTGWLLLGMSLCLARNLLHVPALLRK
jgi:CubicO group peptidase (beta-lactamase class C family)